MNQPRIKQFRQVPKIQVRIEMPDGKVYGIVVHIRTPQHVIDELVHELTNNPNTRLKLQQLGGYNLILPEQRVRLFYESEK